MGIICFVSDPLQLSHSSDMLGEPTTHAGRVIATKTTSTNKGRQMGINKNFIVPCHCEERQDQDIYVFSSYFFLYTCPCSRTLSTPEVCQRPKNILFVFLVLFCSENSIKKSQM